MKTILLRKNKLALLALLAIGLLAAILLASVSTVEANSYAADKIYLPNNDRFATEEGVYINDFYDIYLARDSGKLLTDKDSSRVLIDQRTSPEYSTRYQYSRAVGARVGVYVETRQTHRGSRRYAVICNGMSLWGGSHGEFCSYANNSITLYSRRGADWVRISSTDAFKDKVKCYKDGDNWGGCTDYCICTNTISESYKVLDVASSGEYKLELRYNVALQDNGKTNRNNHFEKREVVSTYSFNVAIDSTAPQYGTEWGFTGGSGVIEGNNYYVTAATGRIAEFVKSNNTYINVSGQREAKSYFILGDNTMPTSRGYILAEDSQTVANKALYLRARDIYDNEGGGITVLKDTMAPYLSGSSASGMAVAFRDEALSKLAEAKVVKNAKFALGESNKSIAFQFTQGADHSPISATLRFRELLYSRSGELVLGQETTREYRNGESITVSGVYTLVATDLSGNTTTYEFVLRKFSPQNNFSSITESAYIDPNYYVVKLPNGYSNISLTENAKYGTNLYKGNFTVGKNYLAATRANADKLAFDIEIAAHAIVTARGYNYKLISNPNQTFDYSDMDEFSRAVSYYSSKFVSSNATVKVGSSPYIDRNITVILDDILLANTHQNTSIFYNGSTPVSLIGKDYIFEKNRISTGHSIGKTSAIYNSSSIEIADLVTGQIWAENDASSSSGKIYGQQLKSVLGANEGYYRVREQDSSGNKTEYIVYYDMIAPTVKVVISEYGSEEETELEVSSSDTLSLYLNTLQIASITDNIDKFSFVMIDSKTSPQHNGIYTNSFPLLSGSDSGEGAGEYEITIYDRSGNQFGLKATLYGKPPRVSYSRYGSEDNSYIKAVISKGESYNSVMGVKIFRNGKQLPPVYYEYEGADPIYISNATLEYTFTRGGIYYFELLDNFSRTTRTADFKFTKGLPVIGLLGVTEGGRTKGNVTVVLPIDCKYLVSLDGTYIETDSKTDETKGERYIYILASSQTSGHYYVKIYKETDLENYNEAKFEVKSIAPTYSVTAESGEPVANGERVAGKVVISWDIRTASLVANYVLNGRGTTKYLRGEELSRSGSYAFRIRDELGNASEYNFVIDTTIDYELIGAKLTDSGASEGGNTVWLTRESFGIKQREANLAVEVIYNGDVIAYGWEQMLTSSGRYSIAIADDLGNTVRLVIEIDRVAPTAYLSAPNGASTNEAVELMLENYLDVVSIRLRINSRLVEAEITSRYEFTNNGKYEVTLADLAGNTTSFTFTIDTIVEYECNVDNGIVTNERVTIRLSEPGQYYLTHNGSETSYNGQALTAEGKYTIKLTDSLGNSVTMSFEISKAIFIDDYTYHLPDGYTVFSLKYNGQPQNYAEEDGSIVFTLDGKYELVVTDLLTLSRRIKYSFTIDRVPPTLELIGVANGGSTTETVKIGSISKPDVEIRVYLDDTEIKATKAMTFTQEGSYRIVLVDIAGNTNEYTFTKVYSLNGYSVALIILGGLALVVVLLLILKIRLIKKVR